jgi:hypothetical protein
MSIQYKCTNKNDSSGYKKHFGLGQLLFAWLLTGFISSLAYAVPMTANYQGSLENADGEPLNATVSMTIALYDTAQEGNALWIETHPQVEVIDGLFSVILGTLVPFDENSLADERYLGVTVESDPEMTPRQELTSAFFAMRAAVAESVKTAAVETETIADGAVTADKIAPQTITGDKIADLSGHSVTELDDVTDAGSGQIITDAERQKLEGLTITDSVFQLNGNHAYYTDGNVGIGTETPKATLDIVTPKDKTAFRVFDENGRNIRLYKSSSNNLWYFRTGDGIVLSEDGSNNLVIPENGNVGIGTINPTTQLHIVKSGNVEVFAENTDANGNYAQFSARSANGDIETVLFSEGSTGQGGVGTNSNHPFYIRTNTVQRMTFDLAGNVGIGRINPQYGLDIGTGMEITTSGGKVAKAQSLRVGAGHIITNHKNGALVLNAGPDGTGNGLAGIWFRKAKNRGDIATYVNLMKISSNGKVGIGTVNPQYKLDVNGTIRGNNVSPSDQRLKQNIQPLENSLAKVEQLRGVSFEWKDKDKETGTQVGLIAQDVETVLPELVSTDNEGYKSLAYDKMTAVLIEAVKELKAQNDALKAQSDALKAIVCEDHPEKAICQ